MIKVWRFWILRPRTAFLASQAVLLSAVLLQISWEREANAETFRQMVGALSLFVAPQVFFYLLGMHEQIVHGSIRRYVAGTLGCVAAGMLAVAPLFWFSPRLYPGMGRSAGTILAVLLLLLSLPTLVGWLVNRRRFVEGLMVVGSGEMAGKFRQELCNGNGNGNGNYFAGRDLLPVSHSHPVNPETEFQTVIRYEDLKEIAVRDHISRIVVAEPSMQGSEALTLALLECKLGGLEVEPAVESYEKISGKLWLEGVHPEWLIYSDGFRPPKYYLTMKRLLDVFGALLLLLVTAPLIAAVALVVKLTSKGPIFFRQLRVGMHGRPFVLLKFRTMREDAEQTTGPVWAQKNDPRITPVGGFLRKCRLDELPQLWNVLWGEMSLIGPRPERPYFVQLLSERIHYYGLRHSVMPGVTGWAQVLYPYGASVEDAYEKLQYDLYYTKHMSLGFDLLILLKTVRVVLFGRGR